MQQGCLAALCLAVALLAGEAAKLGSLSSSAGDVISRLSSLAARKPEVADLSTLAMQSLLLATSQQPKVDDGTDLSLQKLEAMVLSWARQPNASNSTSSAGYSMNATQTNESDTACWERRNGHYIAWDDDEKDCFQNLSEAERQCLAAGDCRAICVQNNNCGGQYRISHGGPWKFYGDWWSWNLYSYELRDNCTDRIGSWVQAPATDMADAVEILEEALRIIKTYVKQRLQQKQQAMNSRLSRVLRCRDKLYVKYNESQLWNHSIPVLNVEHRACRSNESWWKILSDDCQVRLAELQKQYAGYKPTCDRYQKRYPDGSWALCSNRVGSAGSHYKKLWDYWENYISWYDGNMSICNNLSIKIGEMSKNCSELYSRWDDKRIECNNLQASMDTKSCAMVQTAEDGCLKYSVCYDGTMPGLKLENSSAAVEEHRLQQEWRAILRIECLLPVFSNLSGGSEIIDFCIGQTYDLSEISMNFSGAPELVNESVPFTRICRNLSEYSPGTLAHTEKFFSDLPPKAEATHRHTQFCPTRAGGLEEPRHALPWLCADNRTFKPDDLDKVFASSIPVGNYTAGLDENSSWSPRADQAGQSFEVDLGKVETIGGCMIQGGMTNGTCNGEWVNTYWVMYSEDGTNYDYLRSPLRGSHDCNTEVGTVFKPMMRARFVRYVVETWHEGISMRMGLLLCDASEHDVS